MIVVRCSNVLLRYHWSVWCMTLYLICVNMLSYSWNNVIGMSKNHYWPLFSNRNLVVGQPIGLPSIVQSSKYCNLCTCIFWLKIKSSCVYFISQLSGCIRSSRWTRLSAYAARYTKNKSQDYRYSWDPIHIQEITF